MVSCYCLVKTSEVMKIIQYNQNNQIKTPGASQSLRTSSASSFWVLKNDLKGDFTMQKKKLFNLFPLSATYLTCASYNVLHVQATPTFYTYMLHVQATRTYYTYILHVHATRACYTCMLHVYATRTRYTPHAHATLARHTRKPHAHTARHTHTIHAHATHARHTRTRTPTRSPHAHATRTRYTYKLHVHATCSTIHVWLD